MPLASKPIKQAVIAPSMLSLLNLLDDEIDGCSREEFLSDLGDSAEQDIRQAFAAGAVRSRSTSPKGASLVRTTLATRGPAGRCSSSSSS